MATRNRTSLKEALRSCYPDDVLRELAKKAEVQQRTRKVTVTALFWTLILGFGTGVQRSIAELRREFQQASGRSIVRSSFYDRFTPQWTAFLKAVVNWATSAYGEPTEKLQGRLAGFRDVVVTDSTVLRLHNLRSPDTGQYRTGQLWAHCLVAQRVEISGRLSKCAHNFS